MKHSLIFVFSLLFLASCRQGTMTPDWLAPVAADVCDSTIGAIPIEVPPEKDASGFVVVTDVVPDAILEMRYYSAYNFVGVRIDGYNAPVALLTREAAEALHMACDELKEQGYTIKIYDAYRPQRAVDQFVRWARNTGDTCMKHIFYPKVDKRRLFALGFIASRSGHSRGSTVDLTLVERATGREADMGGVFDWFGSESHPDYPGLTSEQRHNRQLLRSAMLHAGFKPLSTEWWHYTLRNEPYPKTYFDFPVEML